MCVGVSKDFNSIGPPLRPSDTLDSRAPSVLAVCSGPLLTPEGNMLLVSGSDLQEVVDLVWKGVRAFC